MVLLLIFACTTVGAPSKTPWREIEPPRPDLQCWVRWSNPASAVCAPSLTSTRGASL